MRHRWQPAVAPDPATSIPLDKPALIDSGNISLEHSDDGGLSFMDDHLVGSPKVAIESGVSMQRAPALLYDVPARDDGSGLFSGAEVPADI